MTDEIDYRERLRASRFGFAVALRLLRDDEGAHEEGDQLILEMIDLCGSAHQALGTMLTQLAVQLRHIPNGEQLLEFMIAQIAQSEAASGSHGDQADSSE